MTGPNEHLQGRYSGMASLLLHSSVTATFDDELPLMFLKYMSLIFTREGAMEVQEVKGQYVWSIIMGLVTLFMTVFSNVILVAALLPGELAHVLILMPFVVPLMVQSLTKSPLTSLSFRYLPKLPTLMPWPGPQLTPEIVTWEFPCPTEMQSSPVPKCDPDN